jgi:hypothetical protein
LQRDNLRRSQRKRSSYKVEHFPAHSHLSRCKQRSYNKRFAVESRPEMSEWARQSLSLFR